MRTAISIHTHKHTHKHSRAPAKNGTRALGTSDATRSVCCDARCCSSMPARAQRRQPRTENTAQRASRPPTMLDGRKELISCVAFDDHLLNSKLLARDQKRVNQAFSRECYEVYIGAKAYLPYATHVGTVSHTPRQIVHMDFANNTSTRLLLSKPLV